VLDNLTYGDAGIKELYKKAGFEFMEGDVKNISAVVAAIKGVDAVIQLAVIAGSPDSGAGPQKIIETNYLTTKMVADACRYHKVNRFLFASSCDVCTGSCATETLPDETPEQDKIPLYEKIKSKSEKALLERHDESFAPTILRMAALYGLSPRMRFDLFANALAAEAVFEKKITIPAGPQQRPLLNVEDAAEAFIKCIEAPVEKVKGEIFNVGDNRQNLGAAEAGRIVHEVVPEAEVINAGAEDSGSYNVSFDKIERVLNFRARRSVEDSVREIRKYIEEGNVRDYREKQYSNYRLPDGKGGKGRDTP
jgi:nucleoside-diphosphate-sugar epimerase